MNLEDLIEDFDPEAQQSPWTQVARNTDMIIRTSETTSILEKARNIVRNGTGISEALHVATSDTLTAPSEIAVLCQVGGLEYDITCAAHKSLDWLHSEKRTKRDLIAALTETIEYVEKEDLS